MDNDDRQLIVGSLDLEMTGPDLDLHGIVQIGLWLTGEDEGTLRGYYASDCNPGRIRRDRERRVVARAAKSLAVNRFTEVRIAAAPPMHTALEGLLEVLRRAKGSRIVLVGAGIDGDLGWLNDALATEGFSLPAIETLEIGDLCERLYEERMGLGRAAKRVGVRNARAHDALADAWCGAIVGHRLASRLRERGFDAWADAKPWSPTNKQQR